jgi:hypothetical protein
MPMTRRLLAVLFVSLSLAVPLAGCGSNGTSHHDLLKSAAGAVILHHELKKHHVSHPLAKSVGAGLLLHHELKKHHK